MEDLIRVGNLCAAPTNDSLRRKLLDVVDTVNLDLDDSTSGSLNIDGDLPKGRGLGASKRGISMLHHTAEDS